MNKTEFYDAGTGREILLEKPNGEKIPGNVLRALPENNRKAADENSSLFVNIGDDLFEVISIEKVNVKARNADRDGETQTGWLANELCGVKLPIEVLRSANGYYLGTQDDDGPVSRESKQYWSTAQEAQRALDTNAWTQAVLPVAGLAGSLRSRPDDVHQYAADRLRANLEVLKQDPRFNGHTKTERARVAYHRGAQDKKCQHEGRRFDAVRFDTDMANRSKVATLPGVPAATELIGERLADVVDLQAARSQPSKPTAPERNQGKGRGR